MRHVLCSRRAWWLAAALVAISGCGGGSAVQADPDQAREALRVVLDAWKAGQTPADFENRTPPIHVKDLDWKNGLQLVSYQAGGPGKLVGYDMNYAVLLELRSTKGGSIKKNAVYTVTTRPQILVARQEG
jgi:hypothetical protein